MLQMKHKDFLSNQNPNKKNVYVHFLLKFFILILPSYFCLGKIIKGLKESIFFSLCMVHH